MASQEGAVPDVETQHDAIPRTLHRCPSCGRGQLVWDNRNAWRCNDPQGKCHRGLAFGGVFEVDSLAALGSVPLSEVPLTDYGMQLVEMGMLALPWLSCGTAKKRGKTLRRQMGAEQHDEYQQRAGLSTLEEMETW